MAEALKNFDRLSIHSITTKPLKLTEAVAIYAEAGVKGITVWEDHLEETTAKKAAKLIQGAGLSATGLCRAGYFVATGAMAREEAKTRAMRLIDTAAELGAPVLVLVCGADPEVELPLARQQILDAIHQIEPYAKACQVKLAIEPLHPMYTDTHSAVNTIDQANNLVMVLDSPWVGIAIDVYHVWWDPFLRAEIKRASGTIFSLHVSDWRVPTRNLLNDRGLMGSGCIPIRQIREWVDETGFTGPIEVEIHSDEEWAKDQKRYLKRITGAWLKHC
jgi:sugar phosphate isomerase/epimerase